MIKVQNIYYMLAYAFQILHEQSYKDIAVENFQNAMELLAAILCRGVSIQIKRGLGKTIYHQRGSVEFASRQN